MMNMKTILDEEKFKDFVSDFNKHFEDLAKRYKKDAEKIKALREGFWKKYPEIFKDSSENEVHEGNTRPKKPSLAEIRKRLLCNRTTEAFTDYCGVESDPKLTLVERMIKLQEAMDDATRRKVHFASLLGGLLQSCFNESKEAYKKTLRRLRLRDSGRNFCVSCTNWFLTITNFSIVRFLFVSFKSTSKR